MNLEKVVFGFFIMVTMNEMGMFTAQDRSILASNLLKLFFAIGFAGLGKMGGPMAGNLVGAGHRVLGFDVVAEACAQAAEAGVEVVDELAAIADGASVVITMLPNGDLVRGCYEGADGLMAAVSPETVLVDSSTIDVFDARDLQAAAADAGLQAIDAPVSGGVVGAEAASLTFMVGGEEDALTVARPALEAMGKRIVHCGPAGSGQAAKACNNMLLAISMIGTCEAFALADKLGLDARKFFEIAGQSSGQCWSITSYAPVAGLVPSAPSNRNFEGGFLTSLMLKDLRLAHEAASSVDAQTPLGAHALDLYERFVAANGGGRDFSSIIESLR